MALFLCCLEKGDPVERLQSVNELVQRLPRVNRAVLAHLIRLFHLIDLNSDVCEYMHLLFKVASCLLS